MAEVKKPCGAFQCDSRKSFSVLCEMCQGTNYIPCSIKEPCERCIMKDTDTCKVLGKKNS